MKAFNLAWFLGMATLLSAGSAWTSARQADEDAKTIVEKAKAYVQRPELLTVQRIEQDFPGEYKTSGCEDRFPFCSYVNADGAERARLSAFDLPYRPVSATAGGGLTFSLPEAAGCYRPSDLEGLLGVQGRRPDTPSGDMFFGADEAETVMLQYRSINRHFPEFSATAFIRHECVVTLDLDLRVRPRS